PWLIRKVGARPITVCSQQDCQDARWLPLAIVNLSEARRSVATERDATSAKPRRQPSKGCPLTIVILSEVRRSAATERESKDPASLSIITIMSGNSHRTS